MFNIHVIRLIIHVQYHCAITLGGALENKERMFSREFQWMFHDFSRRVMKINEVLYSVHKYLKYPRKNIIENEPWNVDEKAVLKIKQPQRSHCS